MVGGYGTTRALGVSVAVFHGVVRWGEHGVLGMVEEDSDGVEGGAKAVGTEETVADQVSDCAGVEVIFKVLI